MRRWLQFSVVLVALVAMLSACKKKQPQVPPPQAQAPTITNIPQVEQPEPLPPSAPPVAEEPAATAPKPKPKPHKKAAKKAVPKPEAKPEPGKKAVIPEGGSEPPAQLSAGLSQGAASQQRQNTAQLLAVTDSNLHNLTRTLSPDEQAMVQQIRTYMQQSHSADTDGDPERAYNLALKARLLSDELAKR